MRPVSERVRDLVSGADVVGDRRDLFQIVDEVQALERLSSARTVHVAANGKFPRFSIDRWIAIVGAAAAILSAAFVAGGRWSSVETAAADIKELKADIGAIRQDVSGVRGQVTAVTTEVEKNREAVDRRMNDFGENINRATEAARNAERGVANLSLRISRGGGPQ